VLAAKFSLGVGGITTICSLGSEDCDSGMRLNESVDELKEAYFAIDTKA
jgi:hypothetical protein